MYGVIVAELGGPDGLRVTELADPVAEAGQVVVKVRAVCVQPADLAARVGMIPGGPVPPPFLPGWDVAGEVAAVGAGVTEFQAGDRVVGMVPWYLTRGTPGAYAEYVAADAEWLVPLPDGLDFAAAATLPLNALTAHQALEMLSLAEPTTLLVTGASGGVGGFATELAARRGHRVLALATHDDADWVGGLGAAEVIPRDTDLGSIGPVRAVVDAVPLGDPALAAVKDGGAVVTTRPTPPADPARGITQHLQLIHLDRPVLAEMVRLAAAGELRTRIAATVPLTEAAEAHRRAEAGGLHGKIVLIA
jgi:NADPH:quinone reductase